MPTLQHEPSAADLTRCDREPIHVPGRVQSHGVLLVLSEPGLLVRHISSNCGRLLEKTAADVLNRPLANLLGESATEQLIDRLRRGSFEANPSYIGNVTIASSTFHTIAHRFKGWLFLELEPAISSEDLTFHNLYSVLRTATGRLKGAATVVELCEITAAEIRRISGFDRVMIYRFDPDWTGLVIAEDKSDAQNSYLGLRFPASDIPQQARQLYLLNRIRLIANVNSAPADLIPPADLESKTPVDLSYAALRSVSPIHIEYLKNMQVGASMSISIVKDGALWGLIACHHSRPRMLPYEVRAALEHLGEIVALQLAAREYAEGAEYRISLQAIGTELLAQMAAHEDFVDGLARSPGPLLSLVNARGCALHMDGMLHLIGETPPAAETEKLVDWLRSQAEHEVFCTDQLSALFPGGQNLKDKASGVLAIAIPRFRKSFIIWLRPELVQTVNWAGDPHKPVETIADGAQRLHPRKSFEAWKQTVREKSQPWRAEEIAAAGDLRQAIVAIILKKAEELATVNTELKRTNKELESFSYSVSHDLRAPFRHILGFSELLQRRALPSLDDTSRRYVNTIMESARFAGTLVDSLLAFSQMSRSALQKRDVDMNALVREVLGDLKHEFENRQISWHIGELPVVSGDWVMLRLAVQNLISNAIKYTRGREKAQIEMTCTTSESEHVFSVRDNGIGFDMRFKDKLFGVFQRLHRAEEFEGTGIGLANVRRTVERHGGRTWAIGEPGVGANFFFSLPRQSKELN